MCGNEELEKRRCHVELVVECGRECCVLEIVELSRCEGDKEVVENTYLKLNAGGGNSQQDTVRIGGCGESNVIQRVIREKGKD